MKRHQTTIRILLVQVLLLILASGTGYALEQIVNGNFASALGTEWVLTRPVDPDNFALEQFRILAPGDGDANAFQGYYDYKGDPAAFYYWADGSIYQTFPSAVIASDTNARVSFSYNEWVDTNGNAWQVNLSGKVYLNSPPTTIIAGGNFFTLQATGTIDNPAGWLASAPQELVLPGGNLFRMQFYWKFGLKKNVKMDVRVDQISCNTSPSGLVASENTSGGCDLDWANSSSSAETFASYRVYVGSSTAGPWQRIDSGGVTTSNYTDSRVYLPPYDEIRYYAVSDIGSLNVESPKSVPAVFKTAKLVITLVEASKDTVTKGQNGVPVNVFIENTGFSPAVLSVVDLYFDPGFGQYNKNLQTILPITLPAGASTTVTFNVDILDTSVPDTDIIQASAIGTNTRIVPGRTIIATYSLQPDSWLIRSPANLIVHQISVPEFVYRDQKDVEILIEVHNDGNKNAAAYWDSSILRFSSGLYDNVRLADPDSLPVPVYPLGPVTIKYLADVNPFSATGTCVINADINFRDINLLSPATNFDDADSPGVWTVVAGVMKTYKGPPAFSAYEIEAGSFNIGNTIVYAKAENLLPLTEQRFRWYDPDGVVRVTDPPITSNSSGIMTDQYSLNAGSTPGVWKVVTTRVTNDIPLAERQFLVVDPAAISILHQLPPTVTLNQVFTATTTITNSGGAVVDDAYCSKLVLLTGSVASIPDPVPLMVDIPGSGQATFNWQFKADALGTITFEGSGYGLDQNDFTKITAATQTSNACEVQGPPILSVASISENFTTVYLNQTGLDVRMGIKNTGQAAVYVDSATLTFVRGSHDYVISAPATMPLYLAGGAAATITLIVSIDPSSVAGWDNITADFHAFEANNPNSFPTVTGLTLTNAWDIKTVSGKCSANDSYNPEQYNFNVGQTVYVEFSGMPAPETKQNYQIFVYSPSAPAGTPTYESGYGVGELSFAAGAEVGKWRAEVWIVGQFGGYAKRASLQGTQYFYVETPGQLTASLSIAPSALKLSDAFGDTFITVTMSIANNVPDSSDFYPVVPTTPVRPVVGYSGAVDSVDYSGPVPASASVSYGNPATFTWVFKTTQATTIGSSFAMIASATGKDLNQVDSPVKRNITVSTPVSNMISILQRDLSIAPDPMQIGTLLCGQSFDFPLQLLNSGNTDIRRIVWNKDFPTSPTGKKIPTSYFYFTPAAGASIATGTAVTDGFLTMQIPFNQEAGTYTAIMSVFDDLSGDGVYFTGEPYKEFAVQVVASQCRVVYTLENQVELGGYPQGQHTATITLAIANGGNIDLTHLKFYLDPADKVATNSFITILPNPFGALATNAVRLASISAFVGADTPGDYVTRFTVWDDYSNFDVIDPWEASATFNVRFSVGGKSFTISPSPLNLGNGTPTQTLSDFPITVTNDGQLTITNPAARVEDLNQGSKTIAAEWITLLPPGPLAPGESKMATLSVYIPAGTDIGPFSGIQYFYDDEPSGTANEIERGFEISLTVNPYYSIQVIDESVSLQGVTPGAPSSMIEFLCRNVGNVPLGNLNWAKPLSFKTSVGDEIDPGDYNFSGPAIVNNGQTFYASVTIGLPAGQPFGNYSGQFGWLFNDNVVASTSDYFTLYCQVGDKILDIIEDELTMVSGFPNSYSSEVTYSVKNNGSLVLSRPRTMAIADLEDSITGFTLPSTSCIFTPATLDPIAGGLTKYGKFKVQIPSGQDIGTYSGYIKVWDDTHADFTPEAGEASDTAIIKVSVTGKRVLTVTSNPADFGYVPAGQSHTIELTLKNSGNMPINIPESGERVKAFARPLNPLSPGPPSIAETKLTFLPVPLATALAKNQTATISVKIEVPPGQTSGPYQGEQTIFVDYPVANGIPDSGEEYVTLLLKVNVNQKLFSITPSGNFGSGDPLPGLTAVKSTSLEVKNLSSIPLSKLKWQKAPLKSPTHEIPIGAFSFLTTIPFGVSSNGSKVVTASLTIPIHQPEGVYSGEQILFEDENGNGFVDGIEASDTFTLTVAVNSFERIQILPSIADLGTIDPGETSVAYDIDVFNVGNVAISGLDGLWNKADLTGAGTLDSSLVNFTSITDPLNPGITSTIQVTVGPLLSTQAAGAYSGIQTLKGQTCELQLQVNSTATAPDLASGTIYQEIATTTFSNVAPETLIFSAYVAATGSVGLGFLETLPDQSTSSYNGIVFDFATRNLTKTGAAIIDYSAVPVEVQGNLTWYRLYMTFNYQFVESAASHTYIILKNATPDAAVAVASYSAWFDGIQLEKAVIPGQTRPTAYGAKGKLISPSDEISVDGKTQHYEW